jgi:ABC-2 type transport system permease protein
MSTGLMDRFRSLPMSRWAVLGARSIAELLTQIISAVVCWPVGMLLVFAPLAVRQFRRKVPG